jgi:hypothetical protein
MQDLITPENCSQELLRAALDAAMMDVSINPKGFLVVQDSVKILVMHNEQNKDRVLLLAMFGFKDSVSELQRLQAANRINTEFAYVRAYDDRQSLVLDWDISIAGGIPPKTFVLAVKRFLSVPVVAIRKCAADLLE